MKRPIYIFLAGKITGGPDGNDWRNSIVPGLSDLMMCENFDGLSGRGPTIPEWPILLNAIYEGCHYVGPYFIQGDHGDWTGENTHGFVSTCYCGAKGSIERKTHQEAVVRRSHDAIRKADLVFAWIDSPDAYGTVAEIGFAAGIGKAVYVAGPDYYTDLWFVYEMSRCGDTMVGRYAQPSMALNAAIQNYEAGGTKQLKRAVLESPIEVAFWDAWPFPDLTFPQWVIGEYRVDFALPHQKIVIELDGHEFHKTVEQRTRDAKRQRYLEGAGWRVIRFTGSEVHRDPDTVVVEAIALVMQIEEERDDHRLLQYPEWGDEISDAPPPLSDEDIEPFGGES